METNSFRMADNSSPCPPSLASVNPPASTMRQPPASAEGHPRAAASSCPTPPVDEHERTRGERVTDRGTPCPRVLILSSDERRLSSLSPFQRREGCDKLGKVVQCEKLRDGGLEVEFQNDKDAERALSATHFTYTVKNESGRRCVQLQIKVSPHRTKNSSRGVIYCPDLEDTSDDDICTSRWSR